MIRKFIAYNFSDLEKHSVISKASSWQKSDLISKEQLNTIADEYSSPLHSPAYIMRVLLFIFSLFTTQAITGFILILFGGSFGFLSFLLGLGMLGYVEFSLIKTKHHYKSGTSEAFIYAGLCLIAFGLLSGEPDAMLLYPLTGLLLTLFSAFRYLDLLSLLSSVCFFMWLLLQISFDIGGLLPSLLPFTFLIIFTSLYFFSQTIQKKINNLVFEDMFIVFDLVVLVAVYMVGNYFVVRELSIEFMGLQLTENEDIPLAWLFYFLTVAIPAIYLYVGIKQKSTLLIRVALVCLTLTALTLKYYFSLGAPILSITIAGGLLITVALSCLNYLKEIRNGFTRDQLLTNKWDNDNLNAFIASQTLGGNIEIEPNKEQLGGGEFGGGGSGNNY